MISHRARPGQDGNGCASTESGASVLRADSVQRRAKTFWRSRFRYFCSNAVRARRGKLLWPVALRFAREKGSHISRAKLKRIARGRLRNRLAGQRRRSARARKTARIYVRCCTKRLAFRQTACEFSKSERCNAACRECSTDLHRCTDTIWPPATSEERGEPYWTPCSWLPAPRSRFELPAPCSPLASAPGRT